MASQVDFVIEQGSTFARTITITKNGSVLNLTGYTVTWQIRSKPQTTTGLVSLVGGSGITLGGPQGTVTILLDAATTVALSFVSAVHELKLVDPDGNVLPRLRGSVRLTPYINR